MAIFGELVSYGRVFWNIVSSVWSWRNRRQRKLTPQERLELRAKWKPAVEAWIHEHDRKKLRHDCIIRDVRRLDHYPEAKETKGISPWFRVALIDTYEKGIMLGLQIYGLVEEPEGWRLGEYSTEKEKMVNLTMTGFVPYENIEMIDWDGDQYYSYPHIYCYFVFKGEPYERTAFCQKRNLDEHVYYTEVAEFRSVLKLTKRLKGHAFLKRIGWR